MLYAESDLFDEPEDILNNRWALADWSKFFRIMKRIFSARPAFYPVSQVSDPSKHFLSIIHMIICQCLFIYRSHLLEKQGQDGAAEIYPLPAKS